MVSVHASSVIDRELESRSGQSKDYEIGIWCFSAKQAVLRRKSKTGWLRIRILCLTGATYLSAHCCFS